MDLPPWAWCVLRPTGTDRRTVERKGPLVPSSALIADIDAVRTRLGVPTAVLDVVRGMYFMGTKVLFISGRSHFERAEIQKWLKTYAACRWEGLYVRGQGDRRTEQQVKAWLYGTVIRPYYDVRFVIDKGFANADMWCELELPVLHVHQDQ